MPGHSPEWSHGDSIAFLGLVGADRGPIHLMSSTGEGRRRLGTGTQYDFGIDWSPDDQWILARDLVSQRLEVIRVATGHAHLPPLHPRDVERGLAPVGGSGLTRGQRSEQGFLVPILTLSRRLMYHPF